MRPVFSSFFREQVHWVACRMPQEQASVGLEFSTGALEQSQCWAGIFPQEQVASIAHTQVLDFLQQVEAAIVMMM